MATAWSADEGQFGTAPNLDTRSCSPHMHTHAQMAEGGGGERGGIALALCKIIRVHLHSLWCGFVAIIRQQNHEYSHAL